MPAPHKSKESLAVENDKRSPVIRPQARKKFNSFLLQFTPFQKQNVKSIGDRMFGKKFLENLTFFNKI